MYNKIFCVGLHKTGTTTIDEIFKTFGIKSTHSTAWSKKPLPKETLRKYTAFSDGGGHFWYESLEFGSNHEIRELDRYYPDSKFILTFRSMQPWLRSKLLHAGWRSSTNFEEPPSQLFHEDWEVKSHSALNGWIYNRYMYHKKVEEYFKDNNNMLCIDITSDKDIVYKLKNFLNLEKVEVRSESTLMQRFLKKISGKRIVSDHPPNKNRSTDKNNIKKSDIEFCSRLASKLCDECSAYVKEDNERLQILSKLYGSSI